MTDPIDKILMKFKELKSISIVHFQKEDFYAFKSATRKITPKTEPMMFKITKTMIMIKLCT